MSKPLQELSNETTGHNGEQRRVNIRPETPKGKFTPDEIEAFYAPFPLEAHSIREGNKNKKGTHMRWFVYLDRIAIQRRLDDLFIGEWEFTPTDVHRQESYVNITATMTIRGVSRSFNGGHGNSYGDPNEDMEKGAMTDTFRRVGSLWGLGAYLYNSVEIWTEAYEKGDWSKRNALEVEAKRKFQSWYNEQYPANGNGNTQPKPEVPNDPPAPPQPETPDEPKSTFDPGFIAALTDKVKFMYGDNDFKLRGSIQKAIAPETGYITPDDSGYDALLKIFFHRCKEDFGLDKPAVFEQLSLSVNETREFKDFTADWVHGLGRSVEDAWGVIQDYKANIDTPPAKPTGKGKTAPKA